MKKDLKVKKMLAALLTLAMLCALSTTALAKVDIPEKAAQATGTTVYQNEKASVDASNLAEGYLIVRYTGGKNVKIKVQITKKGGTTYTYNLNNAGKAETFPLTEGDGTYTVRVFENISGTKYAQAYSCSVELKLRNEFLPFLYSNQYVNFTAESKAVKKGAELMKDAKDDLDAVRRVYNYVIATLKYDYELAATVKSGYLPDIDAVLAAKKGICFDYAALMSAVQDFAEYVHVAVFGVYRAVVGHVVAVVAVGRRVEGRKPYGVNSKALYVVELGVDSPEVAYAVAVAVAKAARPYLIDYHVLVPVAVFHGITLSRYTTPV